MADNNMTVDCMEQIYLSYVQGTEKVFKKVVHPSQNLRLVDKDGIPLKAPNSSTLSRLRSQYVLSPRGVPTKRSNHSYSGQLTQSKLHTVVNSLDTSTQPEMMSYSSVHNYNGNNNVTEQDDKGLSSAPSSQHYPTQGYMPGNLTPKKRAFGSGPPRSVKSMPAKSASTQRSRFLTSAATTTDQMSSTDFDADKTNDSPQGKRLEKEWSALNQCRALKRSSEIVSHRVDRMYFMTGSKLRLQSKYHVEDDDLKHLREISQARTTSRQTRLGKLRKGDVYRPDRSAGGNEYLNGHVRLNGINGHEDRLGALRINGINGKKKPPGPPESPIIKQTRASKSPLAGWAGTEIDSKDPSVANENVHKEILHEDGVNGDIEEPAIQDTEKDQLEDHDKQVESANIDNSENIAEEKVNDDEAINGEISVAVTPNMNGDFEQNETMNGENMKDGNMKDENVKDENVNDINVKAESVHEDEEGDNPDSDGDKTVVKSEDYLDREDLDNP